MHTFFSKAGGRWLAAVGLSLVICLVGCTDPGTNAKEEEGKDKADFKSRTDLNSIKDPGERTAAQALKAAGAMVMLSNGTVTDVGFMKGGCTDEVAKNFAKTPNLKMLTLMGCQKVTDASVATLSGLKKLETVEISSTSITAAGAKKIAAAIKGVQVMHPATQMAMRKAGGGPPSPTGGGGGPGGNPGGGSPQGGPGRR